MTEETWKCPGCGQSYPVTERVCPGCKVTQVRRRPAAEEQAQFIPETTEIQLPHVIPEARFSIPVETGGTWASGPLVAAEEGFFLLSAKDALAPEEVVKTPPAVPGRLGTLSFAIPVRMIKRIVHDKMVGQFIELEGKRVPLRLDVAGWKALDVVCDRLGIPHS